MNYHEDWLMRQIEAMVSAVIHLIFHTSQEPEQVETEMNISHTVDSGKRDTITDFLQKGQICEAENWLYENMDEDDVSWLNAAVYFYSELN